MDVEHRAKDMKALHRKIRAQIKKHNELYRKKVLIKKNIRRRRIDDEERRFFQLEYLVWIHLREERFLSKRTDKLMPRAKDPFKIVEGVNDNAYKVEVYRLTLMLEILPPMKVMINMKI